MPIHTKLYRCGHRYDQIDAPQRGSEKIPEVCPFCRMTQDREKERLGGLKTPPWRSQRKECPTQTPRHVSH